MFGALSEKLSGIFSTLAGRGALSVADVDRALGSVREALIDADVALEVVNAFLATVRVQAVGEAVLRSVSPAQQVVKIVHDALVDLLGGESASFALEGMPPVVILMVGLQGSGKTTTSAKLARYLKETQRKHVLLASLDVYRPAAQEQLAILASQVGVDCLPIVPDEKPLAITDRATSAARAQGVDVLILDTAGRLSIDDVLMQEIIALRDRTHPAETLLVLDAMTGQDAVVTARHFNDAVGITGSVLTRLDGDQRGGAAISLRHITGKPIRFIGTGEKMDALEVLHPARLAGRILDMGDVVSLVERAAEKLDQEEVEKATKRLMAGKFDLNDLLNQMRQINRLGGLGSIMSFLPGLGKLGAVLKDAKQNAGMMKRQEAIILSMTPEERRNPDILAASRKKRIAGGAGVDVADVNRLLKGFAEMEKMVRSLRKSGGAGGLMDAFGQQSGGGMPDAEALLQKLGGNDLLGKIGRTSGKSSNLGRFGKFR